MKEGIMIVEDRESISDALRELLELKGFKVIARASTGMEAIEVFRKTRPRVVLMDIFLPDMNGLDVTREILGIEPDTRVVAMTAMVKEGMMEEALRSGCKAFMAKPFRMKELFAILQEMNR